MPVEHLNLCRRSSIFAATVCALATAYAGAALAAPADTAQLAQASPAPAPSAAASPTEAENPYDGRWHTTLTPYIWLPNINGTLRFNLPRNSAGVKYIDVKAGPNDYLAHLNFASQFGVVVRKGEWAALADVIFLSLSTTTGSVVSITGPGGRIVVPLNVSTSSKITGSILDFDGMRTLAHGKAGDINLLAGVRSLGNTFSTSWQFSADNGLISRSGSVSESANITDGVIGLQGRVNLGTPRWSVPYYLDYGWGDGNTTSQQWLGIANTARHGQTLSLIIRNLAYHPSDSRIENIRFTGPAVAYTFKI
jgi:hypothetical protein